MARKHPTGAVPPVHVPPEPMPGSNLQLDQEYCDCLNRILSAIPPAQEVIDKCKQIGFPVDEFQAMVDEQRHKATTAKALFFPNQP